jgi:hypothetical protein
LLVEGRSGAAKIFGFDGFALIPVKIGPFTDPLRIHSSRIENRYFVKFTATPEQAA